MYKNYEVQKWIFDNVLAKTKIILNSPSGIEFNRGGKLTDNKKALKSIGHFNAVEIDRLGLYLLIGDE